MENWLVAVPVWLFALGWLWHWFQWVRNFPRVADLTGILTGNLKSSAVPDSESAAGEADITVVVPACNEAATIAATLRSLLDQDGVRLRILAVDDRSTDSTGSIMRDVAAAAAASQAAHSLEVISVEALPAGWLGKPHALATAAGLARSKWILFTDADVLFASGALKRALDYAHSEAADHLVVMPNWTVATAGEAAMSGALHALTLWTLRLWRVADPGARDFLGVGAFNLVRREAYEALGGFTALRMEVVEDLRLGWKLKRAGYRQRVAIGWGLVRVRWAHGAWGVVRNLEKNLFAFHRYRVGLTLLACLGLAAQVLLPLAALFAGGWGLAGAVVFYGAVSGVYWSGRRVTRVSPRFALTFPAAAGLLIFAMLRSMVLALWRGGVVWRGTLYPLRELRAHAGRFW